MNRENQNVEFKVSWRDEYLKWICGFANAQGGTLYVGVDDDGTVVGLEDAKRLVEDIPNKIRDILGIVADVNLQEEGSRSYLEIVVKPSNVPISFRGQYHYRSGSTKQELKGAALQDFLLKKTGRQWDDLYAADATIKDIDPESVKYFIMSGIDSGRVPVSSKRDSISQILKDLHLMSDDGKLKNAALLLFAKDPLKFFVGVRFKIGRMGHSESDLIAQDIVTGNILQMADRVMEILKTKYLVSYYDYDGMRRRESLEIPEAALRELLYNALAHKDYQGVDIQMQVFDNRIVLWNPGDLPESFSIETLLTPHKSVARNQNIADVFFRAGFVEAWGQGIGKVREAMELAHLEMPTFKSTCGGLEVTVKRKIGLENHQIGTKPSKIGTEKPQIDTETNFALTQINTKSDLLAKQKELLIQILKIIAKDNSSTIRILAVKTGKSPNTIQKYMQYLVDNEYICHIGSNKGGHWEILKK